MSVETVLHDRLKYYTGMNALVSDRITPNVKTQDTALPAITYQRISSQRFSAMSQDSGVVKARFQIDVWGKTYSSTCAVRDLVRAALQRWSNSSGNTIFDTFIINETDLYEDDTRQHHIAIDVEINYSES